jgi:hypothetical protein
MDTPLLRAAHRAAKHAASTPCRAPEGIGKGADVHLAYRDSRIYVLRTRMATLLVENGGCGSRCSGRNILEL